MTHRIVLENMKHRPMRSLLSALLIGVPVTLILCLIGLSRGLLEDSQERARGIGADVLVRASSASAAVGYSGTSLPEAWTAKIEQQPHVALAMGVVVHPIELPLNVMGIDLDTFRKMSGGFQYLEGGPLQRPDDVLVDQLYASQKHLKLGGTVRLLNRDWRVAGIIGSGKLARIVVDKKVLQDLEGAGNKVSVIYVKCDDPSRAGEVADELRKLMVGYPVNTMEEFTSMFSVNNIPALRPFISVIVGIGVIIAFFVVCLSMYMAVLQRTREIGILKSLGASNLFIVRIIMAEAVGLAIGGTLVGILLSYGAAHLIRTLVPASFPMIIVKEWWLIAGGVTMIGALLGALYPGLNAARHDPIEALAYE